MTRVTERKDRERNVRAEHTLFLTRCACGWQPPLEELRAIAPEADGFLDAFLRAHKFHVTDAIRRAHGVAESTP